jgi:HD-GYP domain-containing protein (c-di-GMP phosphodiesterase class II)
MNAVRAHPAHSERILSRIAAFARVAPIAGAHHEKLDGSGYHRGIASDGFPPLARILVVADMFEAMYADRPYRAGMPVERILDIFRCEAGTKIDPDAVDALKLAIDHGALDLRSTLTNVRDVT